MSPLIPSTLSTPRLTLSLYNHTPTHFSCYLSAVHSPTAHASMGNNNLTTQPAFDAAILPSRLRHPKFPSGVCEVDLLYLIHLGPLSGPLIGIVSLTQGEGKPVDVGWAVCEGYMGCGYATEAAREVLRWVMEDLGVDEVIVTPSETNEGSNRVAEKLGFVPGGKIVHEREEGKMRNVLVLARKG